MKRMSAIKAVLVSLLLLTFATYILQVTFPLKEMFGAQGGELVQLATSHVPTEEDLEAMRREAQLVRRDLRDMTGSDTSRL